MLEEITGITETEVELTRNIAWNNVVCPAHFEDDFGKEINNLKKKIS